MWLLVCAIEILCVAARVGPTGECAQVKEGYSEGIDRDVDNHGAQNINEKASLNLKSENDGKTPVTIGPQWSTRK